MADPQTPPSDLQDFTPQPDQSGGSPALSAPPSDLQDYNPDQQPSQQPQSFNTPGGNSYTVGQSVQHSDGTHGEVTGQHPTTGNAVIKWHQGAENYKPGMMVRVNGHTGVVAGKSNNGKVMVDWGDKGITSVSPGDIEDTGHMGSFLAGAGQSLMNTIHGVTKIAGVHNAGLDESQRQISNAVAANPMSGKAGELAGDLVQFFAANGIIKAGTGAITALPAAEQYAQAAKITKMLADHPILARILHAGINGAVAQGGLSGVQSGGDLGATAKGAAVGAAMDLGGEFAPDALAAGKSLFKKTGEAINTAGKAGAEAIGKVPEIPEKIWPDKINAPTPQAIRDALQPVHDAQVQKISDAIINSVKDEGIDLQPLNDISKMPQAASDALKKEAALNYKQVDEAVEAATGQPGKYQATDEEIANLKRQLRENSGDAEKAAKIQESLKKQQALKGVQMQAIKDAGLEDVAAKASRLSKKANAMEDFKDKLLGVVRTKGGENIQINPDNFRTALRNMENDTTYGADGRLNQAFGQHSKQLIKDVENTGKIIRKVGDSAAEARRQAAAAISRRKTTRNVALATGILGGGADIIRHVVE